MRSLVGWFILTIAASPCWADLGHDRSPGQVSLRNAPIPPQMRNDIVRAIARDFADEPKGSLTGRDIALTSWVSFVPLSRTGARAILISSGADDPNNGATGNGEFWLFRRVGAHAVLILKTGGFEAVPVRGIYHNGMLDFRTAWNLSCCEGSVAVYRFDGIRYRSAYCSSYTSDQEGNMKYGPRSRCPTP
jgi:hypothetical protein